MTHGENYLPVNEFWGKLLAYAGSGKSVPVREQRCILTFSRERDKGMIPVPRKVSKLITKLTVPQTNTSGWVEYTQAIEITRVKELGNIASVTSG